MGNAEWAEDRVPVWYIMDEFGARVQHSADAPNVRMVPFISTIDGAAYSLLFPVQNVDEGEEITRQGYQMAKFDPYLSLDCSRVEDGGRNPRKRRDQILQHCVAEP